MTRSGRRGLQEKPLVETLSVRMLLLKKYHLCRLDGAGTSSNVSADLDGVDETSPNLIGGLALMGQPASVNSAYSAVKAIRSTVRSNPSFVGGAKTLLKRMSVDHLMLRGMGGLPTVTSDLFSKRN